MEEIRPVLFILSSNPEMRKAVTALLSAKIKTCVITAEYIRDSGDPYDAENFAAYDKASGERKVEKRNASINRAFGNKSNKLFVVDLDQIPKELLGQYAFMAKINGCRLLTLSITQTQYRNGKYFIFLNSTEFGTFAKLFEVSTPGAKIISAKGTQEGGQYIEVAAALVAASPVIVIDCSTTTPVEFGNFAAFATPHGYSILEINTKNVDIKNPSITVEGKPLLIPKNATPVETGTQPGSSDTPKTPGKITEWWHSTDLYKRWKKQREDWFPKKEKPVTAEILPHGSKVAAETAEFIEEAK